MLKKSFLKISFGGKNVKKILEKEWIEKESEKKWIVAVKGGREYIAIQKD